MSSLTSLNCNYLNPCLVAYLDIYKQNYKLLLFKDTHGHRLVEDVLRTVKVAIEGIVDDLDDVAKDTVTSVVDGRMSIM